mgnify:CR=1 FL=1
MIELYKRYCSIVAVKWKKDVPFWHGFLKFSEAQSVKVDIIIIKFLKALEKSWQRINQETGSIAKLTLRLLIPFKAGTKRLKTRRSLPFNLRSTSTTAAVLHPSTSSTTVLTSFCTNNKTNSLFNYFPAPDNFLKHARSGCNCSSARKDSGILPPVSNFCDYIIQNV